MIRATPIRIWFLIGVFSLCEGVVARALDPGKTFSQYIHDRWGSARGSLGGTVYAICQSEDGYLWIGTERGLVRFDGSHFVLFSQPVPHEAPLGPVRGLVSDSDGDLWIRLEGTRLIRYKEGQFTSASSQIDLGIVSITAMSPDSYGGLLLAGFGNRTIRYHENTIDTIASAAEVNATVISLTRASDQKVWIGTRDDGLFRVDSGQVAQVAMKELAGREINALVPTQDGGLWVGTDGGIKFLDSQGHAVNKLPSRFDHLQISSLVIDKDSNLWAGTDHGLLRINRDGEISTAQGRKELDDKITAVYEDRDGDLWFGDSEGIERLRDATFTTYSTPDGLPPIENGPIYADYDGRTWFAPLSGGLYWLKDGHIAHESLAGFDNDVIYSITGGGGEIWVGRQRGGLTVLTRKGESVTSRTYRMKDGLAQDSVFTVHRNHDGIVWAGTVSAGVSKLEDGIFKNYTTADGLPSNTINSIVETTDGTVWLATPNGLCFFSKGKSETCTTQGGLPSSEVRTMFEDTGHALWIASSGGLAVFSSGRIFVPHSLPDPLHEQIFGIAEDGLGHLWFATSDHVVQVNRDHLLNGLIVDSDVQSFGTDDGLQWIEAVRRDRSLVADSLGRVWISLNHGLAVAESMIAQRSAIPANVRIESLNSDGLEVKLNGSPLVPAGTRSITIGFAGTSISGVERIRFRYMLDGTNGGWSGPVELNQVIYRNLGPGSYRFHIVASNSMGLWNGPEASLAFVIERTFWQTLWFRVSCSVALVLGVVAFYRLRIHQVAHRLDILFQERLAERSRIARELHDTLLQSFQGLMFRFQTVEEMLPDRPANAQKALGDALDLADQALMESRDAIQDIRSSPGVGHDLAKALNNLMAEVQEEVIPGGPASTEISLTVVGKPQIVHPMLHAEILRIAREAMRNAFRHAHARRIETELTYDDPMFRLRLRDDGTGIDPDVLAKGRRAGHWGLVGMEERAKRVGGRLDVWSKPGVGTEVELRIPGHIAYPLFATRTILGIFRRKARPNVDLSS